jgi:methyl-accepting chemotaxis protein
VAKLVTSVKNIDLPRLLDTTKITDNARLQVSSLSGYYITKNPKMLDSYKAASAENSQAEMELINVAMSADEKHLVAEVKELDDKYSQIAEKKFIPLVQADKKDEAYQVLVSEMAPTSKIFVSKVLEYQDFRNKQVTDILNNAAEQADKVKAAAVFAAVLAAILGILIGLLAARKISQMVNQLVESVQKIAQGDLTEQVKVTSQDEIGQLATAFNNMTMQLKNLVKQISVNAEQVAASSEELTANSEQSAQASNQVAASITEMVAGATAQTEAVNQTAAVVEKMSAGIQQIAANANQLTNHSIHAADKAKNGDQAVEKAIQQMNKIENTVNSSATVVAKLGEQSKEIGQIVDTISGIAGQTNLLALNAAIEAARAGEQGRGFAVVAEEVRKLAEQSQEAAKKIAELIEKIQGDTDKAVIAMNEGTHEVKTGAEVVNAAGVAFREIINVVGQVSDQIKEISAAIQQMAAGGQQIVDSVQKIDDLSRKSTVEAQGVSAATEEQLASMEEIASSSQALAKLAQDLQTMVFKFKV